MRGALSFSIILGISLIASSQVPGAASPQQPRIVVEADPVLVGAGDIGDCTTTTDTATAALLDTIPGTVFAAGDLAYPLGSAQNFTDCYEPTWGRHRLRTRPAVGNHEYLTAGAVPYYSYFGAHAGTAGVGYYSYNLGAWHIIVLNSNIARNAGSVQEQWLRADLAANPTQCTLAYWHHPRFSSGQHGNDITMRDLYQALYDFGADVLLTGHDHNYEQFSRQNPDGVADLNGIKQFVVGTGGTALRPFGVIQPNSAARNSEAHGVLKLTLHPTSYDWEFVPVAGQTYTDVGTRPCVGTAPAAIGGRGFALGSAPAGEEMVWTTGTAQTGYAVARIANGVTTILPSGSFLPGTATDFTDPGAVDGQFTCYAVLPRNAGGTIGNSDVLCSIPGSGSLAGKPPNTRVRLEQGTMATVTWSPPGGQTAYALVTIPLNGGAQGVIAMPSGATRAMHETLGIPTCYLVVALNGSSVTGYSDVVCAVPGVASL